MSYLEYIGNHIHGGIFRQFWSGFEHHGHSIQMDFEMTHKGLLIIDANNTEHEVLNIVMKLKATKSIEKIPLKAFLKYADIHSSDGLIDYQKFESNNVSAEVISDFKQKIGSLKLDISKRESELINTTPIMIELKFVDKIYLTKVGIKRRGYQ